MAEEDAVVVGAAEVDITPPLGTHITGGVSEYRPAREILDPLYARAVVVEAGGRRVGLLALDLTMVTAEYTARIREAAGKRWGIEPEAMMVHAIQTHTAPSLGPFMLDEEFPPLPEEFRWLRGADEEYCEMAVERAIEAVARAVEAMRPAQVGAVSAIDGRYVHNRRAIRRDGTAAMVPRRWEPPLGPTWMLCVEGPADPELGVVAFREPGGRPVAVVVSHTCHPVNVFPEPVVSADWPGALSAALRELAALECPVVVINGACGNINPWWGVDPDYSCDHIRMGRAFAETAARALEHVEYSGQAAVNWAVEHVALPVREPTAEELSYAEEVLREQPEPQWADEARSRVEGRWMEAASIYSVALMRRRSATLDYEIQALRAGDVAIVGLPGEPFVELGLEIKRRSPAKRTYIAHCTTHYVGYIPTPEAYERGGHEVTTRYWAKLTPQSFGLVRDGALRCLRRLFG